MKKRGPVAIVLLSLVTFGIYSIVWLVKTKDEMNSLGAKIPTGWWIIVPFLNIYWLWLYCEGVALVTKEKLTQVIAFILMFAIGPIGAMIVQDSFNKVAVKEVETAK